MKERSLFDNAQTLRGPGTIAALQASIKSVEEEEP